jgi:AcrR family transcriptional regulator
MAVGRGTTEDGQAVAASPRPALHDTAARIIAAATDLFWERGFRQTSVRDITAACHLTQGALYVYFPSKDVLLAEIVKYADGILEERTTRTVEEQSSGTVAETLCALVDAYVWYVIEHQRLARVANLYWGELREQERDTARAVRTRVTGRFTEIVLRGIENGSFAPLSADETRLLTIGLLTMMNGIMDWYRPGGRLDRTAVSRHFQEMALRLVGKGDDWRAVHAS